VGNKPPSETVIQIAWKPEILQSHDSRFVSRWSLENRVSQLVNVEWYPGSLLRDWIQHWKCGGMKPASLTVVLAEATFQGRKSFVQGDIRGLFVLLSRQPSNTDLHCVRKEDALSPVIAHLRSKSLFWHGHH
jgi:hypothetical protein